MQCITQCGIPICRELNFLPQGIVHTASLYTCNMHSSSAAVGIKNVPANTEMYKLLWAMSRWISLSLHSSGCVRCLCVACTASFWSMHSSVRSLHIIRELITKQTSGVILLHVDNKRRDTKQFKQKVVCDKFTPQEIQLLIIPNTTRIFKLDTHQSTCIFLMVHTSNKVFRFV